MSIQSERKMVPEKSAVQSANDLSKVLKKLGMFHIKLGVLFLIVIVGFISVFWQTQVIEGYKEELSTKENHLLLAREKLKHTHEEYYKINENYDGVYKPLIDSGFVGTKRRLDLIEIIDGHKQDKFFVNLEYRLDKDLLFPIGEDQRLSIDSGAPISEPMGISVSSASMEPKGLHMKGTDAAAQKVLSLSSTPVIFNFELFDLNELVEFIDTLRAETPGQLVLKEWWIKEKDDVDQLIQDAFTHLKAGETKLNPPLSVHIEFHWNIILNADTSINTQS